MGIFSCQNVFLKSNGYQLTSADIGPEFTNLIKIKHIGHVFHSVLGPELESEGKNIFYFKKSNTSKIVIKSQNFDKDEYLFSIAIFGFKLKLRA